MDLISKKDCQRITRAIAAAEKKTSGEIVAVVAHSSDDYRFIPLLWAALLVLALPLFAFTLTKAPATTIYAAQLAVFATIAMAILWRPLRLALVPGAIKRARAHAQALEQFLSQDLHTTKGRTGVLIFISVAERYVEVIADDQNLRRRTGGTFSA
jgi:putative membrane protein